MGCADVVYGYVRVTSLGEAAFGSITFSAGEALCPARALMAGVAGNLWGSFVALASVGGVVRVISSFFFIFFYFELLLLILGYEKKKKNTDFKRCGNSEFPSPHLQLVEMMTIPGPLLLVAAAVAAAS